MKNNRKPDSALKQIFRILLFFLGLCFKGLFLIFRTAFRAIPLLGLAVEKIKELFRFSITFKITTVYAFLFSLLLLFSSAVILVGFRFYAFDQVRRELRGNSQDIGYIINRSSALPEEQLTMVAQREEYHITVFDEGKKVLYASSDNDEINRFQYFPDLPVLRDIDGRQVMVFNTSVNKDARPLYIQITKGVETENMYIRMLFIVLMAANSISVLTSVLVGSRVSRKMLKPIETMTETVKSITINNLDKRLDVRGSKDELKELAQTFNQMIDRIQNSYERQNQFVSDASHELRTPISVIQGYASLLDRWGKDDRNVLEESISAVKSESENMKDLTEKLLFLARADKDLHRLQKEDFIMNELIDEVVRETKLIDADHEIISEAGGDVRIYADRKALKQAIRVFVDNSIKFTPPGGKIKIGLYTHKNHLVVVIEDTGIGIPAEDIPHVFDRFYRSDKSRSKVTGGHGLGLSIAKWIIDSHKGKIEIRSNVNEGTRVSIHLPCR